jgi:2-phospho-L-lactate guanylyltransferase
VDVLIPVKALAEAKLRLSERFHDQDRQRMARAMAHRVVSAAGAIPVSVVCDDPEIAEWAAGVGANIITRPGRGLNGAVNDAVAKLRTAGAQQVIVAHADLPFAADLGVVAGFPGVTLVPDRHGDGTNVCCVPADAGFVFHYGPGSFRAHVHEAARVGQRLRVLQHRRLGWDIDRPADMAVPADLQPTMTALLEEIS